MPCEEYQELITALIDGELTADERLAVERHLQVCPACRAAHRREGHLIQQTRAAARRLKAPPALRRAIEERLAARPLESVRANETRARRLRTTAWRPAALAAAAVLVIVAALAYIRSPAPNISAAALEVHASAVEGKTFGRSDDPAAMRERLSQAVGGHFRPVALDLSAMRLYPVLGFLRKIDGRDVLVTVYQGDGPTVTCFTFIGGEADAPEDADKFYDPEMRINFYSFSRNGVNGLLHREGDVNCLLASKMPTADLLAIIRGKTAHA
jgi:anti-sigma factor RsiW